MNQNPARTDTNNLFIVGAGVLSVLIIAVLLVWLRSWFFVGKNEAMQKMVLSVENPKLQELRESEELRLGSYGWVDKENGVVHIPIDRAMELMAAETETQKQREQP